MNPEQEAHLGRVQERFRKDVEEKYRRGQAEHGGDLHKKPAMLKMLREEVLDAVVYQTTLEEQIRAVIRNLSAAVTTGSWELVDRSVDELIGMCEGEVD